jgi:transcriptional regulator with GAF, ATPase, and Fis domain
MAEGLLGRALKSQMVYATNAFFLQRFMTDLDPQAENYIGEAIMRENGELEYLKTYRLSTSQTKRVYLLSQLAAHEWNLAQTATALNNTLDELVKRLEKVGFGYLIDRQVREQVTKRMKS